MQEHFDAVVDDIQSPLNINAFLIPNWVEHESRLADIQDEWKLYLRFLSTLGKFPMMSMWKSQQKALQEGLLEDNKSLMIAMPTSAGKTKTVEI